VGVCAIKSLKPGGVLGSLVRSRDVGEEAITTQTRAERVEIFVSSRPIWEEEMKERRIGDEGKGSCT